MCGSQPAVFADLVRAAGPEVRLVAARGGPRHGNHTFVELFCDDRRHCFDTMTGFCVFTGDSPAGTAGLEVNFDLDYRQPGSNSRMCVYLPEGTRHLNVWERSGPGEGGQTITIPMSGTKVPIGANLARLPEPSASFRAHSGSKWRDRRCPA